MKRFRNDFDGRLTLVKDFDDLIYCGSKVLVKYYGLLPTPNMKLKLEVLPYVDNEVIKRSRIVDIGHIAALEDCLTYCALKYLTQKDKEYIQQFIMTYVCNEVDIDYIIWRSKRVGIYQFMWKLLTYLDWIFFGSLMTGASISEIIKNMYKGKLLCNTYRYKHTKALGLWKFFRLKYQDIIGVKPKEVINWALYQIDICDYFF